MGAYNDGDRSIDDEEINITILSGLGDFISIFNGIYVVVLIENWWHGDPHVQLLQSKILLINICIVFQAIYSNDGKLKIKRNRT